MTVQLKSATNWMNHVNYAKKLRLFWRSIKRKRKEAESEAEEIIKAAHKEADALSEQARIKTEEFVARRTTMAENKISQAEAQALSDVKSAAVEMAVAAAESIVAGKMTGASADQMIKSSIAEVKARLN